MNNTTDEELEQDLDILIELAWRDETTKEDFKSQLLELIRKQNTPSTIAGRPIEEVYMIIRALDFERITNIIVTMKNIDLIYEKLLEDMRDANQRAIDRTFKSLLANSESIQSLTKEQENQ